MRGSGGPRAGPLGWRTLLPLVLLFQGALAALVSNIDNKGEY